VQIAAGDEAMTRAKQEPSNCLVFLQSIVDTSRGGSRGAWGWILPSSIPHGAHGASPKQTHPLPPPPPHTHTIFEKKKRKEEEEENELS